MINGDELLEQKDDAVQFFGDLPPLAKLRIGENYTYSEAYGNWKGETGPSGRVQSGILQYPVYRDVRWYALKGRLAIDEKHRARLWAACDVMASSHHRLNMSLLQSFWSGRPYGMLGTISLIHRNPGGDNAPCVTNPGYRNPLTTQTYCFTAEDPYRTRALTSTNLALNYSCFTQPRGASAGVFLRT